MPGAPTLTSNKPSVKFTPLYFVSIFTGENNKKKLQLQKKILFAVLKHIENLANPGNQEQNPMLFF
tara:strand:- start:1501 stop:1698 length:198 start_codon:yes stop_codon:yes gene_type:complete